MRFTKSVVLATTMLSSSMTLAYADVKVVASIKPVHSLVSAVMDGVAKPTLLVEGAASPHTYSLKPSQAKQLQEADIVFWMSHDLEAFLENSIENIAQDAVSVPLIESHNLTKLSFREGGAFDAHGHDDHDDKHDDHDDKHDDHDDKHDDHDDKHDDHDDKHDDHDDKHDDHDDKHDDHDETDPHVWLDPQNAKALVHEIEEQLAKIDPENAEVYEANASIVMKKLDKLTNEIDVDLKPIRSRGYVVFHDAYQYFEKRFGISAIGSITVSPEVMPGAERVRELQEKVRELDATCVFSEPQFQPKLVATVTENTNAGTGVLDPLGVSLEDSPELYFKLIRNMANSLKGCLMKTG
jgi:zinc transport system substrate-binding protein